MAAAVMMPLLGSVLAFVLPARRGTAAGLVATVAAWVAAVALAVEIVRSGAPARLSVGGWDAPLGIALYADGLASLMVLVTTTVGVGIAAFAWHSLEAPDTTHPAGRAPTREAFFPLWLLVLAALHVVYLSADLFNVYVALELLSIAAVGLVVIGRGVPAMLAGTRYLFAAFTGSMAYLMGVALLFSAGGTLDMYRLAGLAGGPAATALALMTVGLLLKTGLFPLHFWLPPAHSVAPAPVSPVLSALVVKASAYLVVRLWVQVLPEAAAPQAAQVLGMLGALAVAWGSLEALRQQRLKLLVAYSTVAQVGYVFLLLPIAVSAAPGLAAVAGAVGAHAGAATWQAVAWSGGLWYAASHALAKASLFMCAGILLRAYGTDQISELRGAATTLPVTTLAFGAAAVSLVGLPPSGGFFGKWLLLTAAIGSGQWWWAPVIVGGSLATAAYLVRAGRTFFVAEPRLDVSLPPRSMEAAALVLGLGALVIGLAVRAPLELLRIGAPLAMLGGS